MLPKQLICILQEHACYVKWFTNPNESTNPSYAVHAPANTHFDVKEIYGKNAGSRIASSA